ncbi:MAG: DUF4271 domain-containing protein [Lutibacter sp.]|nr:DUF4271 domain-containing protein [Lutibacter sp.]MDP3945984.1 DUF4271 domain-containing protein [Lutibacter sp.]
MFEAKEIVHQNHHWVSLVFLAILIFLTWAKVLYKDRLLHTASLFFANKYLFIYFSKEKNDIINLFQFLLFMAQILVLALILYFANNLWQFSAKLNALNGYLLLVAGVGLYFCFRYLIGLFLAEIFNIKNKFNRIVYDKVSYFNNLILWILPFLILSVYANIYKELSFKITFFLLIILLILRYILVLANNKKLIVNNLFYFILYICALEIAPLAIILKLTI